LGVFLDARKRKKPPKAAIFSAKSWSFGGFLRGKRGYQTLASVDWLTVLKKDSPR
jgi:hypothetical protein